MDPVWSRVGVPSVLGSRLAFVWRVLLLRCSRLSWLLLRGSRTVTGCALPLCRLDCCSAALGWLDYCCAALEPSRTVRCRCADLTAAARLPTDLCCQCCVCPWAELCVAAVPRRLLLRGSRLSELSVLSLTLARSGSPFTLCSTFLGFQHTMAPLRYVSANPSLSLD